MKQKYSYIILLIFYSFNNFLAQGTITNLTISPASPTINDTITIYADLQFSSSACNFFNSNDSIVGNSIYVTTQHCIGMLTSICDITDTFILAPLAAGNYTFELTLTSDIDFGIVPCNGGNNANDQEWLQFEVVDATSISHIESSKSIKVFPNPTSGKFKVEYNDLNGGDLFIFNCLGKLCFKKRLINGSNNIYLEMASGVYFISIKSHDRNLDYIQKLILK